MRCCLSYLHPESLIGANKKNTVFCDLPCLYYVSSCLSATKWSPNILCLEAGRSKGHGTAQGWFSQWDQYISPPSAPKVFWKWPCKCRKPCQQPPCATPPCPRHNHRQTANIYPQSFASLQLQDIWKTEKSNLDRFISHNKEKKYLTRSTGLTFFTLTEAHIVHSLQSITLYYPLEV